MSFILDEKTLFSFPEKANNEALMVYMGEKVYGGYPDLPVQIRRFHQAEVARRALFTDGDYKIAGWSEKMTGPGLM